MNLAEGQDSRCRVWSCKDIRSGKGGRQLLGGRMIACIRFVELFGGSGSLPTKPCDMEIPDIVGEQRPVLFVCDYGNSTKGAPFTSLANIRACNE